MPILPPTPKLSVYLDGKLQSKIPDDATYREENSNVTFKWLDKMDVEQSFTYLRCRIAVEYNRGGKHILSMTSSKWDLDYPPMPPVILEDVYLDVQL